MYQPHVHGMLSKEQKDFTQVSDLEFKPFEHTL